MKKPISDEQIDQLMRMILSDAELDNEAIYGIADSPSIWRGVQKSIAAKPVIKSAPWPPVKTFWRALVFGVPSMVAAGLLITFFLTPQRVSIPTAQEVSGTENTDIQKPFPTETRAALSGELPVKSMANEMSTQGKISSLRSIRYSPLSKKLAVRPSAVAKKNEETVKSNFIALSYASSPESGQIVKVRVPSSMMVTLGLVASVEKPSRLVDAEVVVGDDGLTHSIRFIR